MIRTLSVLLALLTLAGLPACTDKLSRPASQDREIRDIHERLSQAMRRHGFNHGIRSQRNGNQDIDSIYVSVPLDALLRRHASLDGLLKDIAGICAGSDYPILIELGARDEKDMNYMRSRLEPELGKKKNVVLENTPGSASDITITVLHPSLAGRK
jgi:hypothetical protein